jgi:hypothetical protein
VIVACAIAGTYLGQLLLAVGLWRARIAPIWVPSLLVLSFAVGGAATTPLPSDAIFALPLVWVGPIVLRLPQAEWERPATVAPTSATELPEAVATARP